MSSKKDLYKSSPNFQNTISSDNNNITMSEEEANEFYEFEINCNLKDNGENTSSPIYKEYDKNTFYEEFFYDNNFSLNSDSSDEPVKTCLITDEKSNNAFLELLRSTRTGEIPTNCILLNISTKIEKCISKYKGNMPFSILLNNYQALFGNSLFDEIQKLEQNKNDNKLSKNQKNFKIISFIQKNYPDLFFFEKVNNNYFISKLKSTQISNDSNINSTNKYQ